MEATEARPAGQDPTTLVPILGVKGASSQQITKERALPRTMLVSAEQGPERPALTSSSLKRSACVMSFSLMLFKGEKGSHSG